MFASGLGCFFAANSFVHLRDRSQDVQVSQKIETPQIEISKNQQRANPSASRQDADRNVERESSDRPEETDLMRRTRERVDKMM